MAKFSYSMDEKEAVLAFKRSLMGGAPLAILKDNGNEIVVGGPMVSVNVKFKNGICETSASFMGKTILGTVDAKIELIEGFTKIG